MIVSREGGKLIVVDQVDHADLASQFASHWGSDNFSEPAPFVDIILAARFHDEGYRFIDDQPKIDPREGRPYNYNQLPMDQRLKVDEETINAVTLKSEYTRLLVSMHRTGLSRRRNGMADLQWSITGSDEERSVRFPNLADLPPPRSEFEEFVKREESWQDQTRKALSKNEEFCAYSSYDITWTNYKLLQVWDRLSLYVCSAVSKREEEMIFPVPRSYSEEKDVPIALEQLENNTIQVSPWPFSSSNLKFSVQAHVFDDQKYSGQSELWQAFYKAIREPLALDFVRK